MRERVVEIAVRRGVAVPQQPELLEVADVREIPDERRLQRRELPRQLIVCSAARAAPRFARARARARARAQSVTPSSPRRLKMSDATIDPSPTAAATRFVEPLRTSPAAKSPTRLVSSGSGSRSSGQQSGAAVREHARSRHDVAGRVGQDVLARAPVRVRAAADAEEDAVDRAPLGRAAGVGERDRAELVAVLVQLRELRLEADVDQRMLLDPLDQVLRTWTCRAGRRERASSRARSGSRS